MTRSEKRERIEHLQGEANTAKDRLIDIENELRTIGANTHADALSKIIWKLEAWQHK